MNFLNGHVNGHIKEEDPNEQDTIRKLIIASAVKNFVTTKMSGELSKAKEKIGEDELKVFFDSFILAKSENLKYEDLKKPDVMAGILKATREILYRRIWDLLQGQKESGPFVHRSSNGARRKPRHNSDYEKQDGVSDVIRYKSDR